MSRLRSSAFIGGSTGSRVFVVGRERLQSGKEMNEIELIRKYYNKRVEEDFKNSGGLEDPDITVKAVDTKGCHGNNTDLLYFHLGIEGERIKDVRYECEYCDLIMYVVAEITCDLVRNRTLDEIANMTERDFSNALGGHSPKALARWKTAFDALVKEVSGQGGRR